MAVLSMQLMGVALTALNKKKPAPAKGSQNPKVGQNGEQVGAKGLLLVSWISW